MSFGNLALILHAHLPFVRHPEYEEFLEEDWLFEALTETYLPLIGIMQRLLREGVVFRLTMTITPTLCAMLQDQLLRDRYIRYLDRAIELAAREMDRNRSDDALRRLSEFYHTRFRDARVQYLECGGDLLAEFRKLRDRGCLEIMASAATHGLLPLLQTTPEAVRAQILIGCDAYRSTFGAEPNGFWLPECAYAPGLETELRSANLRWFVLDAQGLIFGEPRPRRAIYAPCYTSTGPAVFGRDRDSSRQVWSASEGYPGNPAYRDFYRDIGFDRPVDYISGGSHGARISKFTGLKYHRITGREGDKELYDPAFAETMAEKHASDFIEARRQQFRSLEEFDFDPIVIVPFDAELFGHWWFEGPRFLEALIRKATEGCQSLAPGGDDQSSFRLTTPTEFLANHTTLQTIAPAPSSWGESGYLGVWLDDTNSWIYPHLHSAACLMTEVARAHANDTRLLTDRVLKQLARELLLAQSSDWPFLIKTGTARTYATKRVTDHLLRFNRLHDQFTSGSLDEGFLCNCEWRDNLFPDLNWRYYLPC